MCCSPWGHKELDTLEPQQHLLMDLPCKSVVKNPPPMQEMWVRSLGWEDPLEEGMAAPSSILAWKNPMGRGAWQSRVHRVAKN